MKKYDMKLKEKVRTLRTNMTKQEIVLWQRLRNKPVLGVKFNRQKPMYGYILDFYSTQIQLAMSLMVVSIMMIAIVSKIKTEILFFTI